MEDSVRRIIPEDGGTIVQFYGDGVLTYFPNTLDAVQGASALQ